MNKEAKIIFSISILIIAGVVALLAFGPKENTSGKIADNTLLVRDTSHMTGKKDAKVTIVEFGDYECPACAMAEPILKQIISIYGKNPDFNFVFRNFPLPQHKNSLIAAEAAEAAGEQGKFWEMNSLLYENQSEWSESANPIDIFVKYAGKLGLDKNKFKNEIENNKYDSIIEADKADGEAINVSWTPSIYINGELQKTMPTLEQFKSKIDELLKK